MMFVDSVGIMLQNVLKQQFCLVLNQFVYVGDVSGDTSPIICFVKNRSFTDFLKRPPAKPHPPKGALREK